MKILYSLLILLIAYNLSYSNNPMFVTSIHPVAAIINEIVQPVAKVEVIIPANASPHTFAPKPSDIRKSSGAVALIYVHESLDGWAASIPAKNKINLMNLLPVEFHKFYDGCGHDHSYDDFVDHGHSLDPHFWTDPLTVKALLPALIDTLAKLDPTNANSYRSNGNLFSQRLDMLHRQVGQLMSDIRGKSVYLFHPAFLYMLDRYNLVYEGSVEEIPGKEISPRQLAKITAEIRASGTKAIFSEPQLPKRPAELIAKEAKVELYELDPTGGVDGRRTYAELILYNVRTLRRALY